MANGVFFRPHFEGNRHLTIERLRDLLDYDPETGTFVWKISTTNVIPAGSIAGSKGKNGYISIQIDGKLYRANRLAWFYSHGRWPKGQIDHANCVTDDNRLQNLRDATCAQNQANARRRVDNKSGYKGVSQHGLTGKWSATIQHEGKRMHLGLYPTPEAAFAAYSEKLKSLKGEFARAA